MFLVDSHLIISIIHLVHQYYLLICYVLSTYYPHQNTSEQNKLLLSYSSVATNISLESFKKKFYLIILHIIWIELKQNVNFAILIFYEGKIFKISCNIYNKSSLIQKSKEYKQYGEKKKVLEKIWDTQEISCSSTYLSWNCLFSVINLQFSDHTNISAVDKAEKWSFISSV